MMTINLPFTKPDFFNQILHKCGMLAALFSLLIACRVEAQDVEFSTVDPGQTKAITEWGIEVVQGNSTENARLSKVYMGEDKIDVLWSFFWPGAPLDASGELVLEHKIVANNFITSGAKALLPNAAWGFGPNINDTDAYLGGRLLWRVNEDWRLRAGVEYEYLKEWEGRFSTHSARLDFSRSFYATFGLQREF